MSYFNKANELYNLRNYKRAIDLYKKSVELKENEAASLYNSAVCFIKLKQYTDAIPLIKSAIKIKRESKYYFNLAFCYAMLKENGKALNYFNTAWSLDNSDDECDRAIKLILDTYKKTS
ncbi:tetratricopeptide repeat protein [Clostridium sp.]|uniref:tetratricopeptide repeat protein n=1 Tax=Clostridium sp. TaxID=1506 RepID=UPI002FC8477B